MQLTNQEEIYENLNRHFHRFQGQRNWNVDFKLTFLNERLSVVFYMVVNSTITDKINILWRVVRQKIEDSINLRRLTGVTVLIDLEIYRPFSQLFVNVGAQIKYWCSPYLDDVFSQGGHWPDSYECSIYEGFNTYQSDVSLMRGDNGRFIRISGCTVCCLYVFISHAIVIWFTTWERFRMLGASRYLYVLLRYSVFADF